MSLPAVAFFGLGALGSTLFFLCILYLAVLSLNYSVRLSTLTRQATELAQEIALLRAEREEAYGASGSPDRERKS